MYAITNISDRSAYALINSSDLYASADSGKKWEVVFTFPFYIKNIKFANSQLGVAIGKKQKENDGQWVIFKTLNGGHTWDFWFETNSIFEPMIHGNDLFYLNELSDYKWDIKRIGLLTNNNATYKLAIEKFKPYKLIIDINNQLFVAGTKNDTTFVYCRDKKGEFIELEGPKIKSSFPFYFNTSGKEICLVLGIQINNEVKYKFYTYSNGKTWTQEDLAIDSYLEPVYFGKDNIWGYSGGGRIQIRN